MREIKFRGKTVSTKEWVYGDLVHNAFNGHRIFPVGIQIPGCYPDEVISETVGQFTGLHDKNGKEIYEWDILKNPDYEEAFVVEYHEGMAGYVGWGDDKVAGCYLITDDEIEVIGNIYER